MLLPQEIRYYETNKKPTRFHLTNTWENTGFLRPLNLKESEYICRAFQTILAIEFGIKTLRSILWDLGLALPSPFSLRWGQGTLH